MCNKPSLLAKTLDNNTIPGPNAKAVHFEVSTDGNQLRQVNVPSFVLRRVMNEGNRAQTALSMKMSTTMKIMVTMMVSGAVSDNGGVRDCTKGGKDNKDGGKNELSRAVAYHFSLCRKLFEILLVYFNLIGRLRRRREHTICGLKTSAV